MACHVMSCNLCMLRCGLLRYVLVCFVMYVMYVMYCIACMDVCMYVCMYGWMYARTYVRNVCNVCNVM